MPQFSVFSGMALLVPFLIGSIPIGYLIGLLYGVDLRATGSGNIGATNAARSLGKKAGVLTLVGDICKGIAAVCCARLFSIEQPIVPGFYLEPFFGLAAILGHCYSPFLRLNGGKGVATSLGVFAIIAPIETIVAVIIFALNFLLTKIVSLSSLLAAWVLVIALAVRTEFALADSKLLVAICAAFVISVRHRTNIARLMRGEEPRYGHKTTS